MEFYFDRMDGKAFEKELIEFRRDLHRHPESAWTEYRTTVRVMQALEGTGAEIRFGRSIHTPEHMYGMPPGETLAACERRAAQESGREDLIAQMQGGFTGCVAVLEGTGEGPTVAFRVDLDCNEVEESQEKSHLPVREGFRSEHPGLMHACGHDGHAAIGVGAAKILAAYRDRLKGRVIMAFQPAEEGLRGANSLTRAGLFSTADYLFGGHIGLKLNRLGAVAAGSHGFLASTKFDAIFQGKAAHAGVSPELGRNALAAAATAVLNLLAIPRHSAGSSRINIGTLHAGTGRNVIPELAKMAIETRGVTSDINEYVSEQAQRICKAAADMYECGYESRFMGAAGSAVCDGDFVKLVMRSAAELPGVVELFEDMDFGGGEDITYMMNEVQSHGGKATEMMLGCGIAGPHHSGTFDFDEAVLPLGAQLFAKIVLDLCQ